MKYFAIAVAGAFCCLSSFAQLISGKVISERGFKAAGIKVSFKSKSNSVITNPDGSFKIMATSLPDTLTFSAEGYEPYKVVVTEKTVKDLDFEVVLLEERAKLGRSEDKELRDMVYSSASIASTEPGAARGGAYSGASIRGGRSYSAAEYGGASSSYALCDRPARTLHFTDTVLTKDITRRSQLLSAAEVNDFKKWKMWEDYNQDEFKSFSQKWNVFPTHRYSVQLQNNEYNAIVGERVYLINTDSRDTVWRAITDNTGKAELWSRFSGKDSGNYLLSINSKKIDRPLEFANGVNTVRISQTCDLSDKVEIAFVVDATGSMSDEIEYLKLELEDVIRGTFEKNKGLDLNIASVFYRDNGDEYITRHVNFNNDLLKVLNFIKLQSSGGGGDYPEAVNSALRTAIDSLSWSDKARSKIIFLILDAPPHDEAAAEMIELTKTAAAKGIRIVPMACSGTDKSTEFLMRSIALATNGTYLFLTDHSGVGNSHIKPTTDAFDVELLNTLLSRTIEQIIFAKKCNEPKTQEPIKIAENISSVNLYPNPTKGNFTIKLTQPVKEMFITDFTGKILMRIATKSKDKKYDVDISAYPSATYMVRYITEDHKWGSEKVVLIR